MKIKKYTEFAHQNITMYSVRTLWCSCNCILHTFAIQMIKTLWWTFHIYWFYWWTIKFKLSPSTFVDSGIYMSCQGLCKPVFLSSLGKSISSYFWLISPIEYMYIVTSIHTISWMYSFLLVLDLFQNHIDIINSKINKDTCNINYDYYKWTYLLSILSRFFSFYF